MNTVDTRSGFLSTSPGRVQSAARRSRISFSVGGISFGVQSHSAMNLVLDPAMSEFSILSPCCDMEFQAEWAESLEIPVTQPAFHSGGLWKAFRESSGTSLYFSTPYLGAAPYKKCWFHDDLTHGTVSLLQRYFNSEQPVYPLEYPLDELLMIHRLSRGDGAEIHGCGVISPDGKGRLFVGHSGAGKSTASRLWLNQPGVRVLSDDRIIVRMNDGVPIMSGTPWHGDAGLAEQASTRLHRIYLLEQAPVNQILPLAHANAAAELFARSFVPYHDAIGIANTLDFLAELTATIPVALLRCTADKSAIQEVLRAA